MGKVGNALITMAEKVTSILNLPESSWDNLCEWIMENGSLEASPFVLAEGYRSQHIRRPNDAE